MKLPQITVFDKYKARIHSGMPWVRTDEIRMTSREKTELPGTLAELLDEKNNYLATVHFNPQFIHRRAYPVAATR